MRFSAVLLLVLLALTVTTTVQAMRASPVGTQPVGAAAQPVG